MDPRLRNPFKEALLAGQTQLGLWLSMANPYCAEIAATAGYDWLLIDSEHAPNDIPTILAQLQAVAAYPCHPVVRPVNDDPALIKQLLDLGAQTLLVPMVDTADQARTIARAMRYPPNGIRGVGAMIARASRWGQVQGYDHDAEAGLCLLVQVETRRGLENLDEITRVEGVDGVFIGAADLSASLGHPGDAGHPEVRAAVSRGIERIRELGKAAGMLATHESFARPYMECGANFAAVAVDTMLLCRAMADNLALYRGGHERPPPSGAY